MSKEKKTFEEWDRAFKLATDPKKARLTREQYVAMKRRQLRSQRIRSLLNALDTIGKRVIRNFGDTRGFED
jgi:hypothetical protein